MKATLTPEELILTACSLSSRVIDMRRELHTMPELRMDTPLTEAYIVSQLERIGASDIRAGVGGHGVTAFIRGGAEHPCTAIRADCDGLPIKEETGLSFASTNGNMHACGHDAHTAMALGAAELLANNRDVLPGSVKLIFQPYEEGDNGAKAMMAAGALSGADEIIALHTGNIMGTHYNSGDVVIPWDFASANIWAFKASFCGIGSHVCTPEAGRNPVYMAAKAIVRINGEVSCLKEGGRPVIAAVTMVNGGVRNNVIPSECVIEGSVRAFDRALHGRLRKAIAQICTEEAKKLGGRVQLEDSIDLKGVKNDQIMAERFTRIAHDILPDWPIKSYSPPAPIGEDFARYLEVLPGFYFFLCSKPAGECFPHHSPRFDIDESVLYIGAALLAAYPLFK